MTKIGASLVCLLTLRLNINMKHISLFFYSLSILTDFSRLLNLRKISDPRLFLSYSAPSPDSAGEFKLALRFIPALAKFVSDMPQKYISDANS